MAQITYDISELVKRYDEAFALAARGEQVIIKAPGHRPVRLVPALEPEAKPRTLGMHPGSTVMAADFNDQLPDEYWLGSVSRITTRCRGL